LSPGFIDSDAEKKFFYEIKQIKMSGSCNPGESHDPELFINTGFLLPMKLIQGNYKNDFLFLYFIGTCRLKNSVSGRIDNSVPVPS